MIKPFWSHKLVMMDTIQKHRLILTLKPDTRLKLKTKMRRMVEIDETATLVKLTGYERESNAHLIS